MQRTFVLCLTSGGADRIDRFCCPAIRIQKTAGRDCASICLLAIQPSASRAELTASTIPPFGYKKAAGRDWASIYFLFDRLPAPRAGLTNSAVLSFGCALRRRAFAPWQADFQHRVRHKQAPPPHHSGIKKLRQSRSFCFTSRLKFWPLPQPCWAPGRTAWKPRRARECAAPLPRTAAQPKPLPSSWKPQYMGSRRYPC